VSTLSGSHDALYLVALPGFVRFHDPILQLARRPLSVRLI